MWTKGKIFIKNDLDILVVFLKNHCKKHLKNHKILSQATYFFFFILFSRGLNNIWKG